jgi:carbon monoxide dehydrogenase subunit G
MATLEPVDLSFFERAPLLIESNAYVAAPRDRVFALISGDPAGWGQWFPGFTDDGRWETPPPYGVGSVRTVRAFRVRYRETILAWDEGARWAFRIDEASSPLFKAFAEDYRVTDDGAGTRLSWTVAIRPSPALRVLAPVLPFGFQRMLRRAASGLTRVA